MGLGNSRKFSTYGFFVYDDVLPNGMPSQMNNEGVADAEAVRKYVSMRSSCLADMRANGAMASAYSCGSDSDAGD